MKILAIETSADETGVSILEIKKSSKGPIFEVLANTIASQIKLHTQYGGIYPMMAKREHAKNLPILFKKVIKKSKIKKVDLVAVTSGPGLEPALWTGIVFAKEKALEWKVPLMPVNHMEGHILSVFGKNKGSFKIPKINYPCLSLLVSGGHTELVLVKKFGNKRNQYKIIGETLDDAVGEAFDKVARMLSLPYPGGPEISKLAEETRKNKNLVVGVLSLPRPMLKSKDFNFSYSGLKTAVLYLIRKLGKLDEATKMQIALEFENAAIEPLVYKTKKAIEKYKAKTLIVAGGVSANKHLRRVIKKEIKIKTLFPDKNLSTDNSIMIGMTAYMKYLKNNKRVPRPASIKAEGNLRL
ncbi:tRNA (adenosine(37)-N6)-threonylcarbamoyltransferase complex transferase subunit TsaD [Candidatus Nomurabacteria bacterium RIFCSPHIGHO2_01_FULL_40_20]|uniref:tRNA N6-adenosine threonylcarbamoyltransferase n=1 Tax=Candidatus Nomurabacteria bacterium RIFCSPHIGHO2_01_FULL_40_20 TaxID=1801738 RepID=A0A1F6V293_9BACT|nr:MAG: tRNA (adenosine(37)-N6)-threonylcarbamoyltransferase complex transferase subunit TsaD [Candidatus Nomurabacteria bacterium RIFCSPHIGHO2_01_FULL_40_20]